MGHIDQYRGPYRLDHIGDGPYRLATRRPILSIAMIGHAVLSNVSLEFLADLGLNLVQI